jgi:hypothetical protein
MLFLILHNGAVNYSISHESDTGYLKYKMGREEKEPKSLYKEQLWASSIF